MNFVPLYIKTDNSLLNSTIKIDDLIEYAKKYNINVLSITDDNMCGVMEFYTKCTKNNIKPIIGLEISYNNMEFILYSKNINGYYNLIKLSTIQNNDIITYELLEQYSSDLILILPYKYIDNNIKDLYENVYIGVSNINEYNLYKDKNKVYLNPILYFNKNDYIYVNYLESIKNGTLLEEKVMDNDFKNAEFIRNNYPDTMNCLNEIVNMCNVKIEKRNDLLPSYDLNDQISAYEYLREEVKKGLKRLFGQSVSKKYIDRLKYELDVINKMGFCDYFLIVADYVRYAKENNIIVGPGRGSAAGSLVSYCLGITTVDPIKYNLLFERFLNPDRISMPDVDIDFCYLKREDVIQYCIEKYGLKKVAGIITFATLGAKQAIRDVARVKGIDRKEVDYICKNIDSRYSLKENYDNSDKLKNFINQDKMRLEVFNVAKKLEGLKRQSSSHACGVVICSKNLDDIVPLYKNGNMYLTGYSMEYLESLGLLKMDFLGLKNLTLIDELINDINDPNLTFDSIPLDDKSTFDIFSSGNTLGVFQFESKGMIDFIKKFKPNCFEDIFASLALYRPGPMDNIDEYILRKQGKKEITYIDPSLEVILKNTYGIIVYQEQIMQIASSYAGYSLSEADLLRRAVSKKKEDVLLKEREKFVNKASLNGKNDEVSNKIYDMILKFASYGFNRSHSVAYAFIAYKMAYLKAHYPSYFIKNLLNMSIGSENTKNYLYEAKLNNIEFIKPNINLSSEKFDVLNGKLIFPLNNIKNIGTSVVEEILKIREKSKFNDIFDFVKRTYSKLINRKVYENLILAGCFDTFSYNKKTLIENLDVIVNYADISKDLDDGIIEKPELTLYPEYTKSEIMKIELDVFGFYLSYNPVTEKRREFNNNMSISDIKKYFDKKIDIILQVTRKKELTTKKGDVMCFLDCEDELNNIDVVIFPNVYNEVDVDEGDIINIRARVERRFDKYQLVCDRINILK